MLKTTLAVLAVSAFAMSGALAANNNIGATVSKDKSITSVAQGSGHYIAPPIGHGSNKTIFSNVGFKYPKGLYFCCYGFTISGADSVIGSQNWVAMQFTPEANATVREIDVGVGYAAGTNQVTIGLYTDDGGVPGKQLKKADVTGLGNFGSCCGLAVLKMHEDVKAGTPYWVTVTTENASNTWEAWNFNSTNEIDPVPLAVNQGSGWQAAGGAVPAPSFGVYGD